MVTHPWKASFRFYAELNDFLPAAKRQTAFDHHFSGSPSVKDAIEGIGVPHPEVDLVLVGGASVGWDHHLADGDTVSVYPVFEAMDISPVVRLRPEPLRVSRFVVDGHLGKLARWLRMLGFDTKYQRRADGGAIVETALRDGRIILTRDRELLKQWRVTHGYWVRATEPERQIAEVCGRLHLVAQFRPFSRCMDCNGALVQQNADEIAAEVPAKVRERTCTFHRCEACGKVYWDGTHVERMRERIASLRAGTSQENTGAL